MNKMAEVVGLFENGTAKVKFDGEEAPSEKEYGFLRHYIPKVGDKVFMMEFNGSYIIFDAVDYQVPAQKPINLNYIKGNTVIEGNLTLKGGPTTVEAVNGKFTKIEAKNIEEKFDDYKELIDTNINEVKTAATKAQSTADEGKKLAAQAQSAADNAQRTANNANTAASNAQSTANSARSTATQLQSSISRINGQISNINSQIIYLKSRIR